MTTALFGDRHDSVSVIVLPCGDWGQQLLAAAEEWTAAWLLSPAFWVRADDLLVASSEVNPAQAVLDALSESRPPRIKAFVLGRDADGLAARSEVELFWALGTQEFKLIRLVSVRVDQTAEEQERTRQAAFLARKYLDAARPRPKDRGQGKSDGAEFLTLNVVIGKTLEQGAAKNLVETDWSANIVAAPEDSPTPLSTDSFVVDDGRYLGFALAHIATAAGLWAGLPKSSYELSEIYPQPGLARFQRVFARAIATDTLALDVALSALQRASNADRLTALSTDPGRPVAAIASHRVDRVRTELVEHMLRGPGMGAEGDIAGFTYQQLPVSVGEMSQVSFWRIILLRLKDSVEGLAYLPRWIRYLGQRRVLRSTADDSAHLLERALPPRLFARFEATQLPNPDAETLPGLKPHPELWAHVRKSLMAAVDSPRIVESPSALIAHDGSRMFFSSLEDVLPDPDARWLGEKHQDKTSAQVESVSWLDVAAVLTQQERLRNRQSELMPMIHEAAEEISKDEQYLAEQALKEHQLILEVKHAEREYTDDLAFALQMREEHPHGLSVAEAGPARKPPRQGSPIRVPLDLTHDGEDFSVETSDELAEHPEYCSCQLCAATNLEDQ